MAASAKKILLVEDDRFLRRACEASLRQRGFTVVPAVDGEEGLRLARSETPDLIRFSNDWFYCDGTGKGRLELYPPAHISGIGRRLHYVSNAVYSETPGQRSNPREAEEVVSLIGAHIRDFPEKSLGVVTMNIPQMELIEDLLQDAPADVQAFCAIDAKFFLSNLETVQGDEMDRIIVSLTYGKRGGSDTFNASTLGPLIKKGGERRLNVAVTRSRSGMIVVSSLTSADLASSGATSEGFRCLRAFLQDLEAAAGVSNFGITNQRFQKRNNGVSNVVFCDSPFEEQVVEFVVDEVLVALEVVLVRFQAGSGAEEMLKLAHAGHRHVIACLSDFPAQACGCGAAAHRQMG